MRFPKYRAWEGVTDELLRERGLVFKSKQEVIECANKMLEAVGDIDG